MGQPCEHSCQVECEFEPRGCLKYAMREDWEEQVSFISKQDIIKSVCEDNPTTGDNLRAAGISFAGSRYVK